VYTDVSMLTRQDEAEFADFYAANYRPVYLAVWATLGDRGRAEELAQEAFTRLVPRWRKVSRYDNPQAWIRTVALRLASNHRQRRGTQREVVTDREGLARISDSSRFRGDDESTSAIDVAIQKLSPPMRAVVVLHYLLDLPVDEIANITGAPISTVKTRLYRARGALAQTLSANKEHCHE
jgi:RNA polymerase sigma-70 factor (ECF subfamily)